MVDQMIVKLEVIDYLYVNYMYMYIVIKIITNR